MGYWKVVVIDFVKLASDLLHNHVMPLFMGGVGYLSLPTPNQTIVHAVILCSSRSLIHNAITSNDFLNNLEQSQIEEIVLCMYEKRVNKGCFIIREGEPGDALYVTAGPFLPSSLLATHTLPALS